MRKTLIFTFILIAIIAGVSILYFSNLQTSSRQNDKVLSLIPGDAALVAQFRYDESFLEIYKDYQPFNAIIGEDKRLEIDQLYTIFLTQPDLQKATQGKSFFLSFHPTANSTELLWLITLNNNYTKEEVNVSLQSLKGITLSKNPSDVLEIKLNPINKNFYLHIGNGFLLGSYKKQIIENCLNSKQEKISQEFITEVNNESKKNGNSLFNLFINHYTTKNFINTFFKNKLNGNFDLLKNLSGFSTLSMNFKSDALMFNGISTADTSTRNYLNLFLHQKPIHNTIKRAFPINTANFLTFGISNYPSFHSGLKTLLKKRKSLERLEQQIQKIKSTIGINFERDLKPLWGKEFATFQLENGEKLGIIQVLNGRKLGFLFEPVSQEYTENIRRLSYPGILYYYFGDPLNHFPRPLYTIIDNYLIVANTASGIQQFLTQYKAEKLLIKEQQFFQFNQLVANQSNIFYFVHTRNSQRLIKSSLQKSYALAFTTERSGLKDFYGLSLQWSSENTHFFTNLCINYIAPKSQLTEALWKFQLNGSVALAPQIVADMEAKPLLLVQDRTNMLYAITAEGEKRWSISFNDKILGPVKQLSDRTLLFNTAQKIYRITVEGDNIKGFPVALPQNASYTSSVSSLNAKDFKIFVPCSNTIFGYTPNGELLTGWPATIEGNILFDLKNTILNNAEYIVAGTETGSFYFFDTSGKLLKKVESRDKNRFKNPLNLNLADRNNLEIITTDTTGTIRSIFSNGNNVSKSISTWTSEHFFYFKNITGDIIPELIFLDKNQLYVYAPDNSLAFNYEFPYPVKNRPQFFIEDQASYKIGIASTEDHLLYLFNSDGTLAKGFPFKGEPNFYIGNLKNDGRTYLICGGRDNYLYAYSF